MRLCCAPFPLTPSLLVEMSRTFPRSQLNGSELFRKQLWSVCSQWTPSGFPSRYSSIKLNYREVRTALTRRAEKRIVEGAIACICRWSRRLDPHTPIRRGLGVLKLVHTVPGHYMQQPLSQHQDLFLSLT